MKCLLQLLRNSMLVFSLILSFNSFSQITVASYDFESGLQSWTDGGQDAGLDTSSSNACNGSNSIYSKDDDTSNNYMTSPSMDLSSYISADFSFCVLPRGLETGEGFEVHYYNGSSWSVIQTYARGTDFASNGTTYSFTISLDGATYTLASNAQFRFSSTASANNEYCYFDDVLVEGYLGQEMDVQGNAVSISDGDTTPSVTDDTDFGNVVTSGGTTVHTFTILNTGIAALNLTGSSPYVSISGTNASDFSVTAVPSNSISASGSTTFNITFDPSADGLRTATLSIANNDTNENPYNFDIQGTGYTPTPEINIVGNGANISDGDTTPSVTDDTDFGSVVTAAGNVTHTFTIENNGTLGLNLTGTSPYVVVSGTNAADFTVTAIPSNSIATSGSTTFNITFDPSADGLRSASISIANDDSDENPYNFDIQGTGYTPAPEIDVVGNGVSIADGDTTPSVTDDTDFGNVDETSGTAVHTFTIDNIGTLDLNLTGASPYIVVSGTNAADFTVTAIPSSTIAASSSTTFDITFNPSALGLRTATITIANNDSDENPYNFDIQGTGTDACGGYVTSFPYSEDFETGLGQWTQDTGDNFDWTRQTGTTPSSSTGPYGAASGSFYMFTEASSNYSNTGNLITPCFDLSGTTNPRFIMFFHMYGSNMGTLNIDLSTDSGVTFPVNLVSYTGQVQGNINSSWIPVTVDLSSYVGQTIKLRIQGITGNNTASDLAIDNITVIDKPEPTIGPGGVTADLGLWLKGTDGLGYTDGQSISSWEDQGRGSDARPHVSGQEPTYRDNVNKNVNFNPVVEFDNPFATFSLDGNYEHNDTAREFLEGDFGYFTQEIFVVMIPDETPINNSFGFMDIVSGDSDHDINETDTTGIGLGDYTGRVSGEIICYAHNTYSTSESNDGYAVAEIGTGSSYDNAGIINTRNNTANTQQELYYNANDIETSQNDLAEYMNSEDTRFWIGRSEGWKASTNARLGEIISYSARKNDTDLTQERNRIQSYLAIKYGITLGVNGTSQDYVDSDGTVIWDVDTGVPSDDVFNYDIAGIGRDDASGLYQKQSRSVNNELDSGSRGQGVLTMGITDIYDTNKQNPNTLNDKEFLVWGNDGVDLDDPAVVVDVDMSTSIAPAISGGTWVQFNGIARTWKVVENGGDIPAVEVQVLTSAIRTAAPPDGRYLMFISDTPNFDPTADYRVMTESTNELGEAIVTTHYDFDNTKYITFGWAPERVYKRSIYFDGVSDYVDMEDALDLNPTEFTISAWVNREAGSANTSVLSKRDLAYTEGYDFKITSAERFEMSWKNGSTQTITSNTVIPEDVWHHLAIIYDNGTARLYIDGVLDNTASLSAPLATTRSFNIAAAGKGTLGAFFQGNIDEVRVWDSALSEDQLRYIMNQEIEDNSNFVAGKIMPITVTKNEVATLPWGDLAGYYPMTTYTYTNTKDESGNGNQGALRNLRTVDRQTAPLPYESSQDGDWTNDSTWANGGMQTNPGTTSIVDNTVTVDWNIVKTNHNVLMENSGLPAGNGGNRTVLGLFVDSNTLTVDGDNSSNTGFGITVTHYLTMDGDIDLEGESQLIQTLDSDLDVTSAGRLERDQQGTADTYTYNYWSAPVGISNTTTNNNSYTLPDVMKDGTLNINFITSGYDGSNTSPIGIADYWIWKFANQLHDDYPSWQHVRSTGTMNPGEGFTMKGPGSGAITDDQNYVFIGKPNNGDINLTINGGNDYLVGNPYASAIDAQQFILDNGSTIAGTGATTGTLYFWEHWGGGNHVLSDYLGGYATYNLSGGTPSATLGTNDPDVGTGGTPLKTPGRYIPVSQGFFVVAEGGGGTINFNNGQRVFQKEGTASSIFVSADQGNPQTFGEEQTNTNSDGSNNTAANFDEDDRMKMRFGFNSANSIRRQLLITVDQNASIGYDWGYDAVLNENQIDDMYWIINEGNYVIQGIDNIDTETILPIGFKLNTEGISSIVIDELKNVPDDLQILLHDKDLEIYHELENGAYEFYELSGTNSNRFEIVFAHETEDNLGLNDNEIEGIDVHYSNASNSVVLVNPTMKNVNKIEMYNVLGQSVFALDNIITQTISEYEVHNLSSGAYIIKLQTEAGAISKKVLVK